eukprot:1849513-Prymnesium_polylepis.2
MDCGACGFVQVQGEKDYFKMVRPCGTRANGSAGGSAAPFHELLTCAGRHGEVRAGDMLYIATNGGGGDAAQLQKRANAMGLTVATWATILSILKLPKRAHQSVAPSCAALDLGSAFVVSLLEQHLCAHASGAYLPQWPSSWDEYVLFLRRGRAARGSDLRARAES